MTLKTISGSDLKNIVYYSTFLSVLCENGSVVEVGSAAIGAVNKSDGCTFWHVGRPIAERPAFALMKMDLLAWAAAQLSVPEFMLWRQVPPMPRCPIPIPISSCTSGRVRKQLEIFMGIY